MEEQNTKTVTKKQTSIYDMINKMKPQLERALPEHIKPDRMARMALTAVRNNHKLGQSEATSLLGAIMTAGQLGLEPNTPLGQCYIIPYNSKNGMQAQFQMGYKGLVELAHRSGQYRQIYAMSVDEADEFDYSYGLNMTLNHTPADKPTGNIVYYYAVYHLVNDGYGFKVWSREKVEAHGKRYSKSYTNGPWQTNFDQMAQKTVLIDLLRYAPKSVELSTAMSRENMTVNVNPNDPDLNVDLQGEFEIEEGNA
jgi:recombination protein RecT